MIGVLKLIQLQGVSKLYANGVIALKDVDITIQNGEFVFIVGQSGAGKSTLVKLLLKEEEPSEGTILVHEKNLATLQHRDIPYYRRNLGVVFQDFRLLPGKTVYENVAFAMEILEASPKEIRRRVPSILGYVGLANKAKNLPHQLSGGEQQRACLARALVNSPSLLIADEPTGNLDPIIGHDIVMLLNEINRKGTTIIMATHAKEIVNHMKKRVLTFHNGRLVRDQEKGGYFNANQVM